MLNYDDKTKLKDVLSSLGVRADINMAYFLDSIIDSNKKIKSLESEVSDVLRNQKILEDKLNQILNRL